jgi:hypothetical protein
MKSSKDPNSDEREALQETHYWLSQEGTLQAVAEARREVADGTGLSEQQIRARFGTQRTG